MKDAVVIVGAARTPLGNMGGIFKDISTQQLGATAIQGALKRAKLTPDYIEEVTMGCVLPAGLGQAPARQAAFLAQCPAQTPATTINKMCGSGMKAIMQAHDNIMADSLHAVIAGGMENMSRAPYLIEKGRFGYRLGHGLLIDHLMKDGLEDAYEPQKSMGQFAETCAEQYHYSRKNLDDWAIRSLERAQRAQTDGTFLNEIEPVLTSQGHIDHDENPGRAKVEKIPLLKPAFKADGVITAANSSSISDGAAALVLMRRSHAEQRNLPILATILGHATHAQTPDWFTTAPIGAIQKVLTKVGWDIKQVDLFEINEAFAVVTMVTMDTLHIPHEKVNIHGGACALGHPIGASGARIVVTLLNALQQQGLKRGIASLCIGGGEATALALEIA